MKRHACDVIGTCSKEEMESSCANAPPAREPENIGAARERETNASEPLAAPEAAGRRETKEPCPMETAKSMGARETNVPKERSAAVRRDGEPLANAAKKRRQKEAAADEHQVAAGERPFSSVREGSGSSSLSITDPACQPREAAGTDRPQSTAANCDRVEATRGDPELNCDLEVRLRLEERKTLVRLLSAGTDHLSPSAVRRIIQMAGQDVMGSAMTVCRLDREARKLATTYPGGDPADLVESMVQICEEEVLDWERTRTVHPDPDVDSDPAQGPTGQKLVEALEETLAEDEATKDPPPGSRDAAWMQQILRQATKVLCLTEEVCDTATKKEWQPCAYNIHRWQMEQEVGHLCAHFGGPDEDEVRVRAQRQARAWLTRAHEGVERAREHIGSHLRKVSGLNLPRYCQHDGPPG